MANKKNKDAENRLVVTRVRCKWREGEIEGGCQEAQPSSNKINKSQGCNVQHYMNAVNNIVLHIMQLYMLIRETRLIVVIIF